MKSSVLLSILHFLKEVLKMNFLIKKLMEDAPKLNPITLSGNTNYLLQDIENEIENIIISSLNVLDKRIKLTYNGYEIAQPDEIEFIKNISIKNTDVYYVKYKFNYDDGDKIHELEYHLAIPFSNGGNIYRINGMQINLLPVVTNKIISIGSFTIFLRLFKDKFDIMCKKINVKTYLNGFHSITSLNCIHIKNYAEAQEVKEKTHNIRLDRYYESNIKTPIPIILLGKYGWKETIRKFYNLTVNDLMIIKRSDLSNLEENFIAVSDIEYDDFYIKLNLSKSENESCHDFITGVSIALTLNENIVGDIIKAINNDDIGTEILLWRIIFGLTKNNGRNSIPQLREDSKKVFDNQEHFLDGYLLNLLESRGIVVDNFFELMGYIFNNFKKLVMTKTDLNDKFLDVYYYLIHQFNINFYSKVVLQLNRHLSSNKRDNVKMIEKAFMNGLKIDSIVLPIIKDIARLVFAKSVDHYNDFLYLKSSSNIAHQEDGNGVFLKNDNGFSTERLRTQDILTTSLLCIKKKKHSPKYKLNIYLDYDSNGDIVLDKDEVIKQDRLLYGNYKLDKKP